MLNTIDLAKDNAMIKRYHIAINVIGFQIGWFSCVLTAASGKPALGVMIALVIIVGAVIMTEKTRATLDTLLLVTVIGTLWDSALTNAGVLVFQNGQFSSYFAPYWIIAMWLLFATTINVSLRWLYSRTGLAIALGMILGPLAYQGGAALGAVEIPHDFTANIILAAGWAVILPCCIKIARLFEKDADRERQHGSH